MPRLEPRPPAGLYLAAFGALLVAAGVWLLDPVLLVYHEWSRGTVSHTYAPHVSSGGMRRRPAERASYSYPIRDGAHLTAERNALWMKSGDSFAVIYHPGTPRRHLVLGLWGLLAPLGLIAGGALLARHGWRDARWVFPIWRQASERAAHDALDDSLEPLVHAALRDATGALARAHPPLRLGWYHATGATPGDLAVWLLFSTDAQFDAAVASGQAREAESAVRDALRAEGYPAEAIDQVFIGFKTREAMRRG